jgi:ABC-2 type transport system permease protein
MTNATSTVPRQVPSYLTSSLRIFDLSIGEMLWSRRTIFMALVVAAPVLIALFVRLLVSLGAPIMEGGPRRGSTQIQMTGPAIFGLVIWGMYLRFIVPVLGVFYGTALIADEVDDKTITYLFTRPIPRSAVLIGKYLAYLACTTLLVLPSVVIAYFLIVPLGGGSIAEAFPSLVADLGMLVVGLASYGAVFALVGTRLKRPLVVGLVFAFGWEPTVLLFPGYLKRLTVAYYMQALVKHEMPQDSAVSMLMQIFREVPSLAVSLLSLGVIIGLTLWQAGRAVEQREYVLEQ